MDLFGMASGLLGGGGDGDGMNPLALFGQLDQDGDGKISEDGLLFKSFQLMYGYFILLNKEEVKRIQNKKMKVIPWTVNKKNDIVNLLKMGVDGIITDYPNIAIPLRK